MVVSVLLGVKLYQESFKFLMTYEDYLDWVVFQQIKRGYKVEQLARVYYHADKYSVESRSNWINK